ncbi:MAG: phosphoserine phosphatase SerB [Candidatus Hydrothermarchaeota archaeon]
MPRYRSTPRSKIRDEESAMYVITLTGNDRPGLIAGITSVLAKHHVNIVDIEQTALQGLFLMFTIVDFKTSDSSFKTVMKELREEANKLGLDIQITPYHRYAALRRLERKKLYVVTVLGRDRPGIVYALSSLFASMGVNIEKTQLIARGDIISLQMTIDIRDCDLPSLKEKVAKKCEELGLDAVVQDYDIYKKEKRLIVFDMDSTIVDVEIINELAKAAGVSERVEDITKLAKRGEIDFEQSLRERVRLLKGLSVDVLEKISENLTFTPGTEELITALKRSGYKIALISGGFSYFTDKIREKLGFDYAFGNKLVIKDGIVTGEIEGPIIDAEAKGRIIRELSQKEGISPDQIVAVGDSANDRIMLQNAGLGVAFNAEEILRYVSDGSLSKNNLIGLLNVLGLSDVDLKGD